MGKTGFIGLGIMGKPMALNLVKAGYELIVSDLNKDAEAELEKAGAKVGTYAEIGAECDIIFTILPSGPIVQSVLFDEGGVASTVKKGAIVADLSSVQPTESKVCAEKFAALGVGFIDCPVSGGEPKAIDGTLAIMAGGKQEDFDKVKPYYDVMGSSALLIGDVGSGAVTKLVNQIIVNLTIATVGEAFTFAAKAGVDPEKVYNAIRGGLAGSTILDAKLPMIVERNFVAGGKVSINHKDLKNVMATAHSINAPLPLSAQVFEIYQYMMVKGRMDEDHCALVKYFEELAQVEVKKVN